MTRCSFGECPEEAVTSRLLPATGQVFGFCADHIPQNRPISTDDRLALTADLVGCIRHLHEGLSLVEPAVGLRDGDLVLLRGTLESLSARIDEAFGKEKKG